MSGRKKSTKKSTEYQGEAVIDQIIKKDDGCYSLLVLVQPLCMSCSRPIGQLQEEYLIYSSRHGQEEAFKHFGITKACCKEKLRFPCQYPLTIDTSVKYESLYQSGIEVTIISPTYARA